MLRSTMVERKDNLGRTKGKPWWNKVITTVERIISYDSVC